MKKLFALLLTFSMVLSLTACGAKSNDTAAAEAAPMAGASGQNTMMAMAEDGTAREEALSTDTSTATAQLPESRKWIVTMYVTAETEDLDGTRNEIADGYFTLVALDDEERPRPVPTLIPVSEQEKQLFDEISAQRAKKTAGK